METVGRVYSVNVSAGGVPKLPVERAQVGRLGVEGDGHHDLTEHGGPHRAVCLFGLEAIERLQAEGHPVVPGSVGENLTTTGIEWSLLPVGTRARIGDELELEIAGPTAPCATQKPNFRRGRFSRISIDLHPSDSRMYARVLTEGEVAAGDPIRLLPPAADSRAADELLLARLDRAEAKSSVAAWRAAADASFDIRIVEDGELAMAASPDIPGPAFNHAAGLAGMPHLLAMVTDFYDQHGCAGFLMAEDEPWPGAKATLELGVYGAAAAAVAGADLPAGVTVHQIEAAEAEKVEGVYARADALGPGSGRESRRAWIAVQRGLARSAHRFVLLAELEGEPVGVASLHVHRRTGWLRGAAVVPAARGRGLQRALVAARIRIAIEQGCDLVGASAEPGSVSARNLEQMGLRLIGIRRQYPYQPTGAA